MAAYLSDEAYQKMSPRHERSTRDRGRRGFNAAINRSRRSCPSQGTNHRTANPDSPKGCNGGQCADGVDHTSARSKPRRSDYRLADRPAVSTFRAARCRSFKSIDKPSGNGNLHCNDQLDRAARVRQWKEAGCTVFRGSPVRLRRRSQISRREPMAHCPVQVLRRENARCRLAKDPQPLCALRPTYLPLGIVCRADRRNVRRTQCLPHVHGLQACVQLVG